MSPLDTLARRAKVSSGYIPFCSRGLAQDPASAYGARTFMGILNWDRLRRVRALDSAVRRVDPDGANVWEQEKDAAVYVPFGARRLRRGVIVRRRHENDGTAK